MTVVAFKLLLSQIHVQVTAHCVGKSDLVGPVDYLHFCIISWRKEFLTTSFGVNRKNI